MSNPVQVRSCKLEDGFYMHISDLIDFCTTVMDVASDVHNEHERRGAAKIASNLVRLKEQLEQSA